MSAQMKPCPGYKCNNTYCCVRVIMQGYAYVYCHHCNCAGPYVYTTEGETIAELRSRAIAAWNALPRELVWTKEHPQAPGWYWVRSVCPDTGFASPAIAYHYNDGVGEVSQNYLHQWAGPIPEPLEPKGA